MATDHITTPPAPHLRRNGVTSISTASFSYASLHIPTLTPHSNSFFTTVSSLPAVTCTQSHGTLLSLITTYSARLHSLSTSAWKSFTCSSVTPRSRRRDSSAKAAW